MATHDDGPSGWRVPRADALGQLLMITGLTGFAVSQPLLSVAGESPATFAFRSVEGLQLVLFALAVAFVPPLVIWGVLRLIALASARASDIAFVVVMAVLAGAAGVQIAKAFGVHQAVLIAGGGLLVAAALVVAYLRVRSVGLWLRVTAILPVGAALLFLFASPTSALLAPSASSVEQVASGGEPPVVLIMLDELPTQSLLDDERSIDRVRFPNLASLVDEDFTWYRDYSVPSNQTLMSIPSILTGTLPTDEGATAGAHPDSIFTLLARTHDLHVFESATKLCALEVCAANSAASDDSSGVLGALREMPGVWSKRVSLDTTPEVDLGEFAEEVQSEPAASSAGSGDALDQLERDVTSTPTRVVDFTETFTQQGPRSGFYFLHLLLPHQPWNFYPDGSRYAGDAVNLDTAEWARAVVEQRHLFQAQYADRLVGDMLATLEASGIYDDALVIVTADHGIGFETVPNGRGLTETSLSEVAYAPLLIKEPHQQTGGIDDRNVMGTDLVPTIADIVGATVDWDVVGVPIGSPELAARGEEKTIYDFGQTERKARTPITFDGVERPEASGRLIATTGPDDSPIAGLVARAGVTDLLGRSVSSLAPGPGSATVTVTDEAAKALSGLPLPTVHGKVSGANKDQDIVLVAVDGTVVTASPVYGASGFLAMWPPGTGTRDLNRIQFLLKSGDSVTTMAIA